jgi:hypothetical protein
VLCCFGSDVQCVVLVVIRPVLVVVRLLCSVVLVCLLMTCIPVLWVSPFPYGPTALFLPSILLCLGMNVCVPYILQNLPYISLFTPLPSNKSV